MNNILHLSTLFLAELGFGSAIVMAFLPNREIGKSWLRFYYGFITLCLALFLLCLNRQGQFTMNYGIITGFAAWIWFLSFHHEHSRLEEYLAWIYAVFSAAMLTIYVNKSVLPDGDSLTMTLNLASLGSGAIFLAFGLLNMIFGHWYLVNRELDVKHLISTSRYLIYVTYARLLFSLASLGYALKVFTPDKITRLTDLAGHGIFFWSRFLAGFGIPLLVVHLTYSSAKIGSNQSATGIMYAGTVFVLMGELLALYLFLLTGVYF